MPLIGSPGRPAPNCWLHSQTSLSADWLLQEGEAITHTPAPCQHAPSVRVWPYGKVKVNPTV